MIVTVNVGQATDILYIQGYHSVYTSKQIQFRLEVCMEWFFIPIFPHFCTTVPIPVPNTTHNHSYSSRMFESNYRPKLIA